MALFDELSSLGLTAVEFEDLDLEKFERIHRPVGKICLYNLKDLVNEAMKLYGFEERVTEGKFRSVYEPGMLTAPLVKFCSVKRFAPRHKNLLTKAVKSVEAKFAKRQVSPMPLSDAYARLMMDKADHFAGLPTLGKKEDDVEALKRAEQCWEGKCPPPPVIGHRGKNTEVVRAVWMLPFEWHIVEASFYYPLYSIVKEFQTIYPVGVISERRYTMRKYSSNAMFNTKFSIDYSGFDASLGTQMIGIAFEILSSMLNLTEKECKVWHRVQTYFATSPFLAPDGKVYKGRRGGVPSGSMFTQLVDSICNAVAIEYAMLCEGVKNYRYLVYGDDSWTICKIGEAPQAFLKKIETHVRSLGLNMNVDKTAYAKPSEPLVFCGHYDIRRGRPLQDAIDKMVYPERPSQDFTTRQGICERVVAYMADADAMPLNVVYLALYYSQPISYFIESNKDTNLQEVIDQGIKGNHRHLPGILQVAELAPKEISSLMKIRAAI
jgi:hypothetical protein